PRQRTAAQGRRREAARLLAPKVETGGVRHQPRPAAVRIPAPTGRPVARTGSLPPANGHLPFLLRVDPRPEVAEHADPARSAEEVGDALSRRRHPRQTSRRARIPEEVRRLDRRLLCRDALVPDATAVIPPGLDLRDYEAMPAVERERPLVVHAPSDPE